jgi:hypothetical protein
MEAVEDTVAASSDWRYALLGALESPSTPRVCTTEGIAALVRGVRPRASPATIRAAIDGMVDARALTKVSRGLYLNRRSRPSIETAEAAQHIRQGAIVSLESVLGECGFLNNPPVIVTAVVPLRAHYAPNVGEVKTSGGQVFRFSALPERFFPRDDEDRRLMLQAGRFYPVAKPEVAALHWLHLARSPRSSLRAPPQDVDFSVLDVDLLKDLAWRWDLSRALDEWTKRVMLTGDIQEPSAVRPRQLEAQVSARQRSHDARARLLAKRAAST